MITWVTGVFALAILAVAALGWALASGRIGGSLEQPYPHADSQLETPPADWTTPSQEASTPAAGVEWSELAPGTVRQQMAPALPEPNPQPTGDDVDGRHEAQDR